LSGPRAYDGGMDKVTDPVLAEWLAVLDESEADIAAGRVVSADLVLSDLEAGLTRLENKLGARNADHGTRGRA
jgi:hypothetical protein